MTDWIILYIALKIKIFLKLRQSGFRKSGNTLKIKFSIEVQDGDDMLHKSNIIEKKFRKPTSVKMVGKNEADKQSYLKRTAEKVKQYL